MKDKIKTQIGYALILKVHKRNPPVYEISCPRGCGSCLWSQQDVSQNGVFKCPYCKKENPIFTDKEKFNKLKVEIKKELMNLPKRCDIHNTTAWKKLRYFVLKRDGGKCVLCGRGAKDNVVLHIDHIKPASLYPELYYDIDNLQTLCQDCNLGKSNLDETDFR